MYINSFPISIRGIITYFHGFNIQIENSRARVIETCRQFRVTKFLYKRIATTKDTLRIPYERNLTMRSLNSK